MSIRTYDKLITGCSARLPGDLKRQDAPVRDAIGKPIPDAVAPLLPHDGLAEFLFHPTRRFRFDFCWPQHRVALEIDGGIFGRGKACPTCGRKAVGAHSSIQRLKADMDKLNEAAMLGFCVLRALPEQLESGEAGALVARAIAQQVAAPDWREAHVEVTIVSLEKGERGTLCKGGSKSQEN